MASDPMTSAATAPRRQDRDTSWPWGTAALDDICTCGHPRARHAYPGPASTPCSDCRCPTFGVLRGR